MVGQKKAMQNIGICDQIPASALNLDLDPDNLHNRVDCFMSCASFTGITNHLKML